MLEVAPASASRREIRASVSLSARTRAHAVGAAARDRELDAAVERLDQLARERRAGGRLAPACGRRQHRGQRWHGDGGNSRQTPITSAATGSISHAVSAAEAITSSATIGRPERAQVQVLERVDVGDEASQQLAAARGRRARPVRAGQAPRRSRLAAARARAARGRERRAARCNAARRARFRRRARRRSRPSSERMSGRCAAREIR